VDQFAWFWGVGSTVTAVVGAVILWGRPGHPMGRLLMAVAAATVLSGVIAVVAATLDPFGFRFGRLTQVAILASEILSTASIVLGSLFVVVRFPSGRRTSRFGTAIELLSLVVIVGQVVASLVPGLEAVLEQVAIVPFVLAYPLAAVDLAMRYRRAGTIERAQFRWLIAAASLTGGLVVLMFVFGDRISWLWSAWIASTMLPTVAVGIAVTRYHLYEIDRIISRTLTYGGVTVGLFAVFVAANLVAQWALARFTSGNAIAVAGSTLLAAAAFSPIRARVQAVVDRRFNRGRYDAERTIDDFAGRLRDELDLTTLAEALQRTTRVAVEPASTALWLRDTGPR